MTRHARRTDPVTSHVAAEMLATSGKLAGQKRRVFLALAARDGSTALELAADASLDRYMVSRRLPDLESAGLVRKGEPKTNHATGRPEVMWWVVWPEERTQLELAIGGDDERTQGQPDSEARREARTPPLRAAPAPRGPSLRISLGGAS